MVASFIWVNKDSSLSLKKIRHKQKLGKNTLSLQFNNPAAAIAALPAIERLDPQCEQCEEIITLNSSAITPQHLADYLLECEMIDGDCFGEVQQEMKEYKGKGGGDGLDR